MNIRVMRGRSVRIREDRAGYVMGDWLVAAHLCDELPRIFTIMGAVLEDVPHL